MQKETVGKTRPPSKASDAELLSDLHQDTTLTSTTSHKSPDTASTQHMTISLTTRNPPSVLKKCKYDGKTSPSTIQIPDNMISLGNYITNISQVNLHRNMHTMADALNTLRLGKKKETSNSKHTYFSFFLSCDKKTQDIINQVSKLLQAQGTSSHRHRNPQCPLQCLHNETLPHDTTRIPPMPLHGPGGPTAA
jgi:hypothetical protein